MPKNRILALWLFICAFMVLSMTAIGAITRLTESGLSITEWNVVTGTLPPLNEEAWQIAFDKYQKTPEFLAKHHWMSMDDFKNIYFWEWFHRLWGRLIGVVFALPLLFFWARGYLPRGEGKFYLGLLILGGMQGALGWFMVKSGLVDRPSVSHFRLAAHLSLALVIYSALLWMGLRNRLEEKKVQLRTFARPLKTCGIFSLLFVSITIIWGAFVAGLDAGMIYNTFPLMGDGVIPPEFGHAPALYDPASIQFTHRLLGVATGLAIFTYAFLWWKKSRKMSAALALAVTLQIILGISTLLSVVWIPLAVAHQIGGVLLLSTVLVSLYYLPWRARIPS